MKGKLLIASIYAPSELNAAWYKLQKKYIKKTTAINNDYKVVLNGISSEIFHSEDVLWVNEENLGHAPALKQLLEYFKNEDYESYLILDSDCFPIRRGWHDILTAQMCDHGKQIAAPVRAENLDLFPHPSAFFLMQQAVNNPRLDFTKCNSTNMLGKTFQEVGGKMGDTRNLLLPLLRTNVVNVHPVAAAIYHHLFYHHGGGSRDFNFRILKRFAYYDHWYDRSQQDKHGELLLKSLFRNPDRFIGRLTGRKEKLIRKWLKLK